MIGWWGHTSGKKLATVTSIAWTKHYSFASSPSYLGLRSKSVDVFLLAEDCPQIHKRSEPAYSALFWSISGQYTSSGNRDRTVHRLGPGAHGSLQGLNGGTIYLRCDRRGRKRSCSSGPKAAFSTILASFTLFSVVPSSSIIIVKLLCPVYVRPHQMVTAGN